MNEIKCGNCINEMKFLPENKAEMTLTDIPYGVVNRPSNGIRRFDKDDADEETFDLNEFIEEVVRVTKGSIYVFCGTEQVSQIRAKLVEYKLTTRLCILEKCLSGSTNIYVKTDFGVRHSLIREIVRTSNRSKYNENYYSKNNYCLWDGTKWNKIIDIIKSENLDQIYEISLRSGEKIRATGNHKLIIDGKTIKVMDLKEGYTLDKLHLPNSDSGLGKGLTKDVPWFIGLYLAEGSRSGTDIQLSLNVDELYLFNRIKKMCDDYAGDCYKFLDGNKLSIIVTGKIIKSFIDQFVFGDYANTKRLVSKIWEMDNDFLSGVLEGYLLGDGGLDAKNNLYALGFSRNEHLTNDLRVIFSRLGYDKLRLVNGTSTCDGKIYKTKRGTAKLDNYDGHHNCKKYSEIIAIKKVNKRNKENFYDIVLENEPHVFCFASGIVSHNSNPSPVNGEYMWLSGLECCVFGRKKGAVFNEHCKNPIWRYPCVKQKLHPTQKPLELFEYLIRTSSNPGDLVLDPCLGSGTTAIAAAKEGRDFLGFDINPKYVEIAKNRVVTYLKHEV